MINRQIIRQEVPIMIIAATLLVAGFMWNGAIPRMEATGMFALLSNLMLVFVVPITLVTNVASLIKRQLQPDCVG